MKLFILISGILIIACLIAEKKSAVRHRRALKHVIHVNGTRGKSSVSRLIAAGLSGCGLKVYCKTTGTLPMTIDPQGKEELIRRRGSANIREQIEYLGKAADSGAEIFVVECMAVDPELQRVCQRDILQADITVITNARVDHVAEMGSDVSAVCRALCGTIPRNGRVFTAEEVCLEDIRRYAAELGSTVSGPLFSALIPAEEPFPENLALALSVCVELGCDPAQALKGMERVIPDPYAASSAVLPGDVLFINGMSANDPASTAMVYDRFVRDFPVKRRVFILNCRPDRGYRSGLMADYIAEAAPEEVWLTGAGSHGAALKLKKHCPDMVLREYNTAAELPLSSQPAGTVIYAIGNIANQGIALMDIILKTCEGKEEGQCTEK